MIGVYAKIPFHAQLKRADPGLASELLKTARGAARAFGGALSPTEDSFFMGFDDSALPCRLRAAEAARTLAARLGELAPRLHGWAVLIESGQGQADEGQRRCRRLWYGIEGDGLFLGPGAVAGFSAYFAAAAAEPGCCARVVKAPYASPALPAEGSAGGPEDRAVERIVDEIGDLVVGEGRSRCIVVLGPGVSARDHLEAALSRLYKADAPGFLRLRAQASGSAPYAPVAEALADLAESADAGRARADSLSGAERGMLEELRPMVDFLLRSPYRGGYSPTLDVRLKLRAQAALRLYARDLRARSLPPLVVLDGIERFPAESVEILSDLLMGRLAEEGIAVLASGSALPPRWPSVAMRRATVPGPLPSTMARAAREAADYVGESALAATLAEAAAGDPFRLRLAERLAIAGQSLDTSLATPRLVARALGTFPPEYAQLFFALGMGEGVLDEAQMGDFLSSIGMVEGIRPLVFSALRELGLIEPGAKPRVSREEALPSLGEAIADGGAAIAKAFSARLLALRERRLILPSTALYRRIAAGLGERWGRFGDARLYLDCVAADAAYGGAEDAAKLADPPLALMGPFLAAYAARDRERARAFLADLASSTEAAAEKGPLSPEEQPEHAATLGSITLAQAAIDYADRRPAPAAAAAKSALISLHSLEARGFCARAHRILGLSALAQEQVQEGADYLSNAFEVAEAIPDPLECVLAAQAEASAHFLLGDFRRTRLKLRAAASWAERSFRADWAAACAFMEGRLELELGRYAAADEAFGRVRAEARVYGREEEARRAEIWAGRSASWGGDAGRARDLLGRQGADAEALWFLAELEAWEGRPSEALSLSERALAALPPRDYPSADAFSWSSGFESLEGRAVGFRSERSYLEDQILAFRDYAAGLASPAAEAGRRAELLALRAREERLAALHPSAHIFLFYRYTLLERACPSSMDGATALSKAFKALQLRSARMEEAAVKDSFMGGNRWNRCLFAEAKARKLI